MSINSTGNAPRLSAAGKTISKQPTNSSKPIKTTMICSKCGANMKAIQMSEHLKGHNNKLEGNTPGLDGNLSVTHKKSLDGNVL